jgi:hypothetical protein
MLARMPDEDRHDYHADGPSLDADGQLVNRPETRTHEGAFEHPLDPSAAPLELQERTPTASEQPPAAFRPPLVPHARRLALRFAIAAAVLAAAGLAAAVFVGPRLFPGGFGGVLPATHRALVVVSEPPGAKVRIGTIVVGTTPWAGDNVWGDAEVTLELGGYKPWRTRLQPGEDLTISATLTR